MATISKENAAATRSWIESWVQSGALPGAIVGVYDENNQELFYHEVSSNHPNEKIRPYKRDSIFRMYSMTKPITSVAALILYERGLLSFEDEVSKFIPSFANTVALSENQPEGSGSVATEPLSTPIKIIHLLTHTSGITYGIFGTTLADQLMLQSLLPDVVNLCANTPLPDLCERIAKTPVAFQPGKRFQYGWSTDVLGRVIEIISGKSLEEFFEEEIFHPLNMTQTTFRVSAENYHRVVDFYDEAPGMGFSLSPSAEVDRSEKRIFISGGGGLVSTLDDYAKFTNMLLRKGKILFPTTAKAELLKEKTIELLTENHLLATFGHETGDLVQFAFDQGFTTKITSSGFGFGLGVSILQDPLLAKGGLVSSVGQYGWTGIAGTVFFVDPVKKVSVIFLTQVMYAVETYPIKQQLRYYTSLLVPSSTD